MSYADVAASGPSQSAAEAYVSSLHSKSSITSMGFYSRAPQPPVVEHREETHTSSIIDVDSPHVISVPSSYSGETTTQVTREEREFEVETRKAKQHAEAEAKKLADKARKGEAKLSRNKDNPVVIGNTAILGIGAFALGWGAYVKHSRGELTGKLVGFWAAGLTAFAVADFFTSQWLFKNKYPPK